MKDNQLRLRSVLFSLNSHVIQRSNKSIIYWTKRARGYKTFIQELLCTTQRKHTFRWLRSRKQDYLFYTPSPWLVFDAIDYIQFRMFKGINVFEYGSGGSTLFWLSYGANVISIEHDSQWYNSMIERLQSYKLIDYYLINPEKIENEEKHEDPSDPENYTSKSDIYNSFSFYNYVSQIDTFPDQYFDIILIDGRSRPSCIKHSVLKIKIGGMVILDNADRDYYLLKTEKFLSNFSKIEFYGVGPSIGGTWKTNIYIRKN